jgi:hypothetical protein
MKNESKNGCTIIEKHGLTNFVILLVSIVLPILLITAQYFLNFKFLYNLKSADVKDFAMQSLILWAIYFVVTLIMIKIFEFIYEFHKGLNFKNDSILLIDSGTFENSNNEYSIQEEKTEREKILKDILCLEKNLAKNLKIIKETCDLTNISDDEITNHKNWQVEGYFSIKEFKVIREIVMRYIGNVNSVVDKSNVQNESSVYEVVNEGVEGGESRFVNSDKKISIFKGSSEYLMYTKQNPQKIPEGALGYIINDKKTVCEDRHGNKLEKLELVNANKQDFYKVLNLKDLSCSDRIKLAFNGINPFSRDKRSMLLVN